MKKCGWLFNRHDWFEAHRTHRICVNCGETQEKGYNGHFSRKPFMAWLDSLEAMQKWDSRWRGSREQALEWLSEKKTDLMINKMYESSRKGIAVFSCPQCDELTVGFPCGHCRWDGENLYHKE